MRTLVERNQIVLWALGFALLWGGLEVAYDGGLAPGRGLGVNLLGGLVFGVAVGAMSTWSGRRGDRGRRPALQRLPSAQRAVARRAVTRGPVPGDREVASVAADLAVQEVADLQRRSVSTVASLVVATVVAVALAVTTAGIYWGWTVALLILLVATLWWPVHLRRRIARLELG